VLTSSSAASLSVEAADALPPQKDAAAAPLPSNTQVRDLMIQFALALRQASDHAASLALLLGGSSNATAQARPVPPPAAPRVPNGMVMAHPQ
jgi:hypothetical protein